MAFTHHLGLKPAAMGLILLLSLFALIPTTCAEEHTKWVTYTDNSGELHWLRDNRKPALYTQDFGDCMGASTINVTRFDAAYYKDNMTVLFHLEGNTAVSNESLMSMSSNIWVTVYFANPSSAVRIGVYAYGEPRFDLVFNPCHAQIYRYPLTKSMKCLALTVDSLCPMNASVPIEANGVIPVASSDVSGIIPLALQIPDFEGQAILRIFSNSTESQIACYSALITNGATFSHPKAVGTVLGLFALVAVGASFATAVYGNHIPTTRTHYAHSLSVFVVFSVLQHIYYTGALSMNWPSVLSAFWSNFAWSAGMIYSEPMQNSINQLIGSNRGNTSMVGAAASGQAANDLGGGYQISQIYKRVPRNHLSYDLDWALAKAGYMKSRALETALSRRAGPIADASEGFTWYGHPVKPGLPLPGNFSGFAGTLSEQRIPASNAFMTGFLWWLIVAVLVTASLIGIKGMLEVLARFNVMKRDKLWYLRAHWVGFTSLVFLRTCFIGFFTIMFLTLFQFTFSRTGGGTAVAAIVFLIFFVGMMGLAGYACFYRLRYGHYETRSDRLHLEKKKLGKIPFVGVGRDSKRFEESDKKASAASVPFMRLSYINEDTHQLEVHDDEEYIKRFGWLASRFRRTRWWFFALWLVYELVRACFYAGAVGQPMTQVFGLLVIELIALAAFCILRPFEGARLNTIMIYCLGFSKVATLALSAAFDARFNLQRITATVIGIVIIVIQGILTIILMIAIVVGASSSYMSVTRNHDDFRPRKWAAYRQRYFKHLEKAPLDIPPPPKPVSEEPKEPYFSVNSIRRVAKIEDEDDICANYDAKLDAYGSCTSVAAAGPSERKSRAASVTSQRSFSNLPFGARPHRQSWSSRDFINQNLGSHSQRNSMLMSKTTLPGHKASHGSLRDEIEASWFNSPYRPGTPQRGFSSPERMGSPAGLPTSDFVTPPPATAMAAPKNTTGLEVQKTRNGKERAVDFAPAAAPINHSDPKPGGLENQKPV